MIISVPSPLNQGSLSQKRNLELNSFCLQEAKHSVWACTSVAGDVATVSDCRILMDGVSLRFPRDIMGAISLIFEASRTGARGEKCFLWLTGQSSEGHQLY